MGNNNIQTNQVLRSRSLLALFILPLGVAWLLHPLISSKNASNVQQTHLRAQGLAYQLFEIQNLAESQRYPASSYVEGLIGKDPWGQQFAYYFSNSKQVLLVSKGPNQRFDTVIDDRFISQKSDSFKGDDIGLWIARDQRVGGLAQ